MNDIVLFQDKKDCCGCGACMNICPKQAVSMREDEYGYVFPQIDGDLCVGCGSCKTVCGYQTPPEKHEVQKVYAAATKNDIELKRSASGGAFVALAKHVIEREGIVYGCAMLYEDGKLVPKHVRVDKTEKIALLQGSKYVQSDIGYVYRAIKEDLQNSRKVLFSGTPCQVAGLKKYLKKEYDNLFLVEIICHGVPNKKLFQDFIESYSQRLGGEITEFYFRDKSKGQGYITRSKYHTKEGNREKIKQGELFAYIHFFSKSLILRESCYNCPFVGNERTADITIGDYWGFHEEYPDYDSDHGLSDGKGVSCVLVNTLKGVSLLDKTKHEFVIIDSTFEKVDKHNKQLHSASKYNPNREKVLECYKNGGYAAIDNYFHQHYKKDILKQYISGMLPKNVKRAIKKTIGKVRNSK